MLTYERFKYLISCCIILNVNKSLTLFVINCTYMFQVTALRIKNLNFKLLSFFAKFCLSIAFGNRKLTINFILYPENRYKLL